MNGLLIFYISLHRKCFFFNILEVVLAYNLVKIKFIKEKEVIYDSPNANVKSRGIQLIGPGCLQRVLKADN